MLSRNRQRLLFAISAAAAVLASVFIGSGTFRQTPGDTLTGRPLRCVIQLSHARRHLPGLTFGYNYELLKRFSSSLGDSLLPVVNARTGESWLDSLRLGKVDILVLPYSDSLSLDSVLVSHPIDGLSIWAVRQDRPGGMQEINGWIDTLMASDGHEALRDLFIRRYSPSKRAEWGRRVSAISPYDSLLVAGAGTLGWDWRLLCALVFHESQFHIEYRSPRGAEGLMQMLPSTAARMGVTDLLDPAESIKAGTAYLRHIRGVFRQRAADAGELLKFTLAAYNAGEGRILDCINYAASVGADSGTWEGLLTVIPQMRDESTIQVDSVLRHGTFNGEETIYYVDRVLALFEDFKTICP